MMTKQGPVFDWQFEKVLHTIDPACQLRRAWELKGGISAQVTALEVQHPDGHLSRMVIRQHGAVDLRHNPHVAADEFTLLQHLHRAGLATPAPYLLDESGVIFPTPYIVVEYIDGTPEFAPTQQADFLQQLAQHLVRIHQVSDPQRVLSFLPRTDILAEQQLSQRPALLDHSLEEGHIRDVLEAAWPLTTRNPLALLHGDYWPGNILWREDQLAGVIDWEDARLGDPLADLGNTRLELVWALGMDAMRQFTTDYLALSPIDMTLLPYWDLFAALRPASKIGEWAGDEKVEQHMRTGHRAFINQAFDALSAQHAA